jgi:phenylacetate-CoA ligase
MSVALQAKAAVLRAATRLPPVVAVPLLALQRTGWLPYGAAYRAHRRFLHDHAARYDAAPQLLRIANHALASVPYYRGRTSVRAIHSLQELVDTFEPIDREVVAQHRDALVADGIDLRSYDECSTGGTSGRPLQLLAPKDRFVIELATMHALWSRAGFDFHPRAVIRNHHLDGRAFVVNPITREVIFDGFRLDPDSLRHTLRMLRALRIRFVHCYPSTAYELASLIEREGIDPAGLVFLSGSENVFEYQRQLIQHRLSIRFYNWYGHSEKLVLGGYCEGSDLYHVEPTYGFCELLDDRGAPVTRIGAVGEIVGSTLHNAGMPLLRYRTGDIAEYAGDHCAACGRHLMLLRNIRGRWSGERVYRGDGSFVTTTALNLHDQLHAVIHGLQYVQDAKGRLAVLVVRGPGYGERHEQELRGQLAAKLGAEMSIEVRYVEQLLRHANGKFTQLISRVAGAS